MGILIKSLNTFALGGTAAIGAFFFTTRKATISPLNSSDPLFSSAAYSKYNPNQNPATQDVCTREVPLSQIKPILLENRPKLVEAFCAGVWGGTGYAFQRWYLERKYRGASTAHQLWTRQALQTSSYPVGTQITDHFEVVAHTDNAIVVRCGDSPLETKLRDSDGQFEMSVDVNEQKDVATFYLKSVFYKGLGKTKAPPMPSHVEFLHRLYTKLWMETALDNVMTK